VLSAHRQDVLRLLLEHRSSLFAFILAVTRKMDTAEDIFQEVSLAVCESAESYELGTNFTAWAREIARRRIAANFRRDRRSHQLLALLESRGLEAGFARADEQLAAQQRVAALQDCLSRLGPFVRQLFELRYAGRLGLSEIAARVSRQPESIRKAIYRGRMTLRKCIERRHPLEAISLEQAK
jgi:RNA polymerase sigma-70 factor, ECF subfamily